MIFWSWEGHDFFGITFVSESIPNREQVEEDVADKEAELLLEAKNKMEEWLNSKGLKTAMGIVSVRKYY